MHLHRGNISKCNCITFLYVPPVCYKSIIAQHKKVDKHCENLFIESTLKEWTKCHGSADSGITTPMASIKSRWQDLPLPKNTFVTKNTHFTPNLLGAWLPEIIGTKNRSKAIFPTNCGTALPPPPSKVEGMECICCQKQGESIAFINFHTKMTIYSSFCAALQATGWMGRSLQ